MRIRHAVVEYDLEEAAAMLDISPADLKQAVSAGYLQCYYQVDEGDYRFHEASLRANKDLLSSEDDYLAKILNADSLSETPTAPDAAEEDPPSTPADP